MKQVTIISSFILALTMTFSYSNNKERNGQIVEGTIKGLGNNSIILIDERSFPIDTVWAVDNQFKFEHDLDISDPIRYGLFIPQLSNADGGIRQNKTYFFIDSELIKITGDIMDENLMNIEVAGSPTTKEFEDLEYNLPSSIGLRKYEEPYNRAFRNYNRTEKSEENAKQLKYYGNIIDSLFRLKSTNIVDAIKDNNESIALTKMVYWNFQNASGEFIKGILDQFSPNIKDSHYLSLLEAQLKLKEGASVGAFAPDFVVKDNEGKVVKLSDFKGDYLLLDFWASWCGPCRKEIPNLILAHNTFKDRGLNIISVSIDSSIDKWEKALQKENLPYIKLYDGASITQKLYQYSAIPYIVLISPEGKIIKINEGLRGEQLQWTLENLL